MKRKYNKIQNPLKSIYRTHLKQFLLILISICISQRLYAYTVQNGCPDFQNIEASYVDAFTGVFDNPFDSIGIVENRHTLNTEIQSDPNTGGKLSTIPKGELKSIRLGNDMIGGEAEAIAYHFIVDPDNSLLFVNFAVVLEDPGHDFIFQPRFVVRVTDKEGNLVSDCSEYDVSAAAGLSGFQDYLGGYTAVRWRDWTKVGLDLTPFSNQEVQVQFITYDCALLGHFGYAYFTAYCAPNKLEIKECSGSSFSVSAPEGFASYHWDNGDTTCFTTRKMIDGNMNIYCEITSVTGCSFTQSAFIAQADDETETFFKDTICQGEPYEKHNYKLPPQYNVGTTTYNNVIFNPNQCSESTETKLELTIIQQFYDIEASICHGEDYDNYGFSIQQPPVGILFDTLRFAHDDTHRCDSIVCLKLTISETLNLPNDIVGEKNPCTGNACTYFIDSDNNSTNYTWTLPENAVVLKGETSPQIVLYFTDDRPGTIILKGENGCGTGAVPFEVSPQMSYHQLIKDTACTNQVYNKYGFNLGKLTTTGYFTHTKNLKTTKGCDSVVVLALTVFAEPKVSIEVEGDETFLCASNRVMLKANGNAGGYILHTCDSLPFVIGDIYCEDGSLIHAKDYSPNKKAVGVVFYVDPDYQYALVTDLKDIFSYEYIQWGGLGYDIPNLANYTKVRDVMNDNDGYGNTAIIRNTGDASVYPVAWSVDFENGWYLPAIGELRLLYSNLHEVNKSIAIVGGNELPSNTNGLSNPTNYFSSSELSDMYFCIITQIGEIMGMNKGYIKGNVRQIRSVKLPHATQPKYKIGDLVENEYGEKGIAFKLNEDGRSGLMVALTETNYIYLWDNQFTDIPELTNRTDSNYYAEAIAAHEDVDGYNNTSMMRKHQSYADTLAVWSFDFEKGWFLPSAGQMDEIYALLPILDSSFVSINALPIYYDTYWTSSEYDSVYTWAYDMAYGNPDLYSKDELLLVRPISKFTYCEPYAELLDSSLTFLWDSGETTPYLEVYPLESTTYSVTATSNNGCSVRAQKSLIVNPTGQVDLYDTICYGEHFINEYFNESESGVYTHTINTNQCDQNITLHLTVLDKQKPTIINDQICQGSTYLQNGFNITANRHGAFYDTLYLSNRNGCDSIVILNLNVRPMKKDTIYARICQNESYFEKGFSVVAYQPTGLHYFEQRTSDSLGCDILQTLALQVDSIYQRSMVDSICQNEQYTHNGFDITVDNIGYSSHYLTLKTTTGCDSIISLSLKVFETNEKHYKDTIGIGESYTNKDFSIPAQNTIGWHTFEKHLTNIHGCDSLIILDLYVQSDEETLNIPTSFTPLNQNGENDVFLPGYEIYVYDRYGLLVCHSMNGWDGTYRGSLADAGVYIYTMKYKSGKEIHGTVEIIKE